MAGGTKSDDDGEQNRPRRRLSKKPTRFVHSDSEEDDSSRAKSPPNTSAKNNGARDAASSNNNSKKGATTAAATKTNAAKKPAAKAKAPPKSKIKLNAKRKHDEIEQEEGEDEDQGEQGNQNNDNEDEHSEGEGSLTEVHVRVRVNGKWCAEGYSNALVSESVMADGSDNDQGMENEENESEVDDEVGDEEEEQVDDIDDEEQVDEIDEEDHDNESELNKWYATTHEEDSKKHKTSRSSSVAALASVTSKIIRRTACGECEACVRDDCGDCVYCLDKTKFGGPNRQRKKCLYRRCSVLTGGAGPKPPPSSSKARTQVKAAAQKPKAKPQNVKEEEVVDEEGAVAPVGRGCKVEGCTKYKKARCDGYCLTCYRALEDGNDDAEEGEGEEEVETKVEPEDKKEDASSFPSPSSNDTASTPKPGGKYCNYEGCTKYKQTSCYGYCLTHKLLANPELHASQREMASLTSSLKKKTTNKSNLCKWSGCEKYIQSNCNGYCLTHVRHANYEEGDAMDVTKVRVRLFGRLQNGFRQAVIPAGLRDEWGFVGSSSSGMDEDGDAKKEEDGDEGMEDEEDERKPAAVKTEEDETSMDVDKSDDQDAEEDAKPSAMEVDGPNEKDEGAEEETKPAAPAVDSEEEEEEATPTKSQIDESKLDFAVLATPTRKANGAFKCRGVTCPKNAQTSSMGFCRAHHNQYLICTGQCDSWACKCGERIADFQGRCGKCHRWRGGSQAKAVATLAISPKSPHAPKKIKDTDNDGTDDAGPDEPAPPPGCSERTYVPPDSEVQISATRLTNHRGRPLCKVIGCGKMDQNDNDGFCRMHFNMFAVHVPGADGVESWTCECGTTLGGNQKRCGNCNKVSVLDLRSKKALHAYPNMSFFLIKPLIHESQWKDGKHPIYEDDGSGFWTCDCGNRVPTAKSRCGDCHHWRGGKRRGGWKLGNINREYDSDEGVDRTQDWECCGVVIPASKTRCGKCNKWRGGKRVAAVVSATSASTGTPWECDKCRISNPGNKRRCGGCFTWRGPSKKSGGSKSSSKRNGGKTAVEGNTSWLCTTCDVENFAEELNCFMCQGLRPNWQWHKKQQMLASAAPAGAQLSEQATAKYPVQSANAVSASNKATATSQPYASAPGHSYRHAQSSANWSTDFSDSSQYYGTFPEGMKYPSLHYDFNQAYYMHHNYSYLISGLDSGKGAADDNEGEAGVAEDAKIDDKPVDGSSSKDDTENAEEAKESTGSKPVAATNNDVAGDDKKEDKISEESGAAKEDDNGEIEEEVTDGKPIVATNDDKCKGKEEEDADENSEAKENKDGKLEDLEENTETDTKQVESNTATSDAGSEEQKEDKPAGDDSVTKGSGTLEGVGGRKPPQDAATYEAREKKPTE